VITKRVAVLSAIVCGLIVCGLIVCSPKVCDCCRVCSDHCSPLSTVFGDACTHAPGCCQCKNCKCKCFAPVEVPQRLRRNQGSDE
jgi:hypothetical protein